MTTEEHRFLTRELIDKFTAKGFEISFADYGGYEKPKHVKKYRPDVVGWDREHQLYHIGKTVTEQNELQTVETSEELNELSNVMMTRGKSAGKLLPFYIVTPKNLKAKLEDSLVNFALASRKNIHCIGV